MKQNLRQILKVGAILLAFASLGFGLFLYRTLELGRGDAQPVILENVNPDGEFLGPEGIQFDSYRNLYVGDGQGLIWKMEHGGKPAVYAQLSQASAEMEKEGPFDSKSIHVGGMAFDPEGNLYLAAYGFAHGSVLRVDGKTRKGQIFARDMGVANYLVLSQDTRHLWVSDYRRQGRILRYTLGGPLPAHPDWIVSGLDYPNGLALGPSEQVIYTAETYSGYISSVQLTVENPPVVRLINLKGSFSTGSLDGLAFDPRDTRRRFLYVAENIRGLFTVLDLESKPVRVLKRLRMSLMGGRPCPASMVIRDGYLYFTDLWACSPIRILLRMPQYHNHAYRFRVTDLTALS